jgi:autotransporter-associated beta strand protein
MKSLIHIVTRRGAGLVASISLLTLLPISSHAIIYTWDITPGTIGAGNGSIDDGSGLWSTTTGNWTTNGGSDNLAWPDNTTDIAEFSAMTGGAIILNGSFSAGGILFGGTGTNGYTFAGAGNPTLSLGSGGITLNGSVVTQLLSNTLSGNNGMKVNGGGSVTLSAANTFTGVMNIGDSSSNNHADVTGRLTSATAYSFNLGRNAFGNNTVDISGSGNQFAQTVLISGNSSSFWVGGENSPSRNNHLIIRNGAYFRAAGGNGTTNSKMGANPGSTHNSITVSGLNSTLSHSGHRFYAGEHGSHNTLSAINGGQILVRVFHVGDNGDNNTVHVTGNGSFLSATECTFMAGGSGTTNNSLTISGGASMFTKARTTGRNERALLLGGSSGADRNSITVTDKGSLLTVGTDLSADFTLSIGLDNSRLGTTSVNATSNSISVQNGAAVIFNNPLFVGGLQSAFNLGNGSDVSTALVYSVSVLVPDARFNIDSGRLQAGITGSMVSGPGTVQLDGPAFISTSFPDSSIDSEISGVGNLIKENAGTLALSATNSFAGDTVVSNGMLRLTHDQALSKDTAVRITAGSTIDLPFVGANQIHSLYIDGAIQPAGTYGQAKIPGYLSGTGFLQTLTGVGTEGFKMIVR